MKQQLLKDLISVDNQIQKTQQQIERNQQQFHGEIEQLIPSIKQNLQKINQLQQEKLPQETQFTYENVQFRLLHNLNKTLQFIHSVQDQSNLQNNIQTLLQQNKLRDAVKQFINVYNFDKILNQNCLKDNKQIFILFIQNCNQYMINLADVEYFQQVKTFQFHFALLTNISAYYQQIVQDIDKELLSVLQKQHFPGFKYYTDFQNEFIKFTEAFQITKINKNSDKEVNTISTQDYVKQMNQLIQPCKIHFDLLLETLKDFIQDSLFYELYQMLNIQHNIISDTIDNYLISIGNLLKNVINNYIMNKSEQEVDFFNNFASSLNTTLSLLYKFELIVNSQIKKFNTNITVFQQNIGNDKKSLQILKQYDNQNQYSQLFDDVKIYYDQSESDYLDDQLNKIINMTQKSVGDHIVQFSTGNNLFKLLDHILFRIQQLEIDNVNYYNKQISKQQIITQFIFFLEKRLNNIFNVSILYNMTIKLDQYTQQLTKEIQSRMQILIKEADQKLNGILRNQLQKFIQNHLKEQYLKQFAINQKTESLVDYLQLIQNVETELGEQYEIQAQQIFNSQFRDRAYCFFFQLLTQYIIECVVDYNRVFDQVSILQFSRAVTTLQQFFAQLLHRSVVEEFKQLRQISMLLGSVREQDAWEICADVDKQTIDKILVMQGVK